MRASEAIANGWKIQIVNDIGNNTIDIKLGTIYNESYLFLLFIVGGAKT
jgi:hypothetical protein